MLLHEPSKSADWPSMLLAGRGRLERSDLGSDLNPNPSVALKLLHDSGFNVGAKITTVGHLGRVCVENLGHGRIENSSMDDKEASSVVDLS
jgi:hypothetical protein